MPKVKIYSTPACVYCQTLKKFLDEKGFKYEDINVAENHQAAEEMIQKSGQMGVPVTDIDGEIVIGFDKDKISELLEIKK
ncbi:MAG: NrdH-redoxin [Candidatus Portnoybacteria bacterium RIFCSPLOWO2_12_FULL_39_9]|nr:MAG: NrdH-redoxin [Candidatus Portnoybacteria bacterium RBG_13_40_8]OGZ36209.1 MAG: NrdH-redoxin [Candidatus Portnoybacteria bacterium RIFCSPHIGHO2_02_FULL_39_12]OGZ38045.1 MAG: NrdH-redoxin [Candidatus Portnoybacteria bacterium RIFCSPLOWO2_01_FULL_38_39]OGZ41074.1 MAG: NrdH-redoxin [Candidatus Portnoybacteria bacterium RIFCSPLOWO2_12_FULL_39_9]